MEQNTRVLLKHLSGSRAGEAENFPLEGFSEITIGRDPSSQVRFDPDKDDLVSRQHAKIAQDAANPASFTITDLNSKHMTWR